MFLGSLVYHNGQVISYWVKNVLKKKIEGLQLKKITFCDRVAFISHFFSQNTVDDGFTHAKKKCVRIKHDFHFFVNS